MKTGKTGRSIRYVGTDIGGNGTGKESVARMIHNYSDRHEAPFVAVNCGAIPGELAASLLFGHAKGAFTGADTARQGYFDLAKEGHCSWMK